MKSVEEIKELLERVEKDTADTKVLYEITNTRYNSQYSIPETNVCIKVHRITSETKVSYVTFLNKKINKKSFKYNEDGLIHQTYPTFDELVKAVFVEINKYKLIEQLRLSKDFDLYKSIYDRIVLCEDV